ncbi:MAG TPA: DUF3160 domain-containing protein, partial [Candidatus Hydrogenedentes bacterium]|nr:DUF3160 domain-containing protein [Candidatus Hydrogenedentota bacterium]
TGTGYPFSLGRADREWVRRHPRGLDLMSALGVTAAEQIVEAEGDADFANYVEQLDALRSQLDTVNPKERQTNLYSGWLYAIEALLDPCDAHAPTFMQSDAWKCKELNTALASWAAFRHGPACTPTGLAWQELPSTASGRPGYIEPVPAFYTRLLDLTRMTRRGLDAYRLLDTPVKERLLTLEDLLERTRDIAAAELAGLPQTEEDALYMAQFTHILAEHLGWHMGECPGTALISHVCIDADTGLAVEEAVGHVDLVLVAWPCPDGTISLAMGPVLSYYEFKRPLADCLTDPEWRTLLGTPWRPGRPAWLPPVALCETPNSILEP